MKKYLLSLLLITTSVLASKEGGNGGNAAVCFNSLKTVEKVKQQDNKISEADLKDITSIQALDIYEALSRFRDADRNKLILPMAGEGYIDFIQRVAKRFETIMPFLKLRIESRAAIFVEKNFRHYKDAGINRIYDAGEGYYLDPTKCVIATVIRQSKEGTKVIFEFDERLMYHPMHSHESQVVLMLHEAIYNWGIELKHLTSEQTQKFIAVILRKDLSKLEVIEALRNYDFDQSGANFRPYAYTLLEEYRNKIHKDAMSVVPVGSEVESLEDLNSKIWLAEQCSERTRECLLIWSYGFEVRSLNSQLYDLRSALKTQQLMVDTLTRNIADRRSGWRSDRKALPGYIEGARVAKINLDKKELELETLYNLLQDQAKQTISKLQPLKQKMAVVVKESNARIALEINELPLLEESIKEKLIEVLSIDQARWLIPDGNSYRTHPLANNFWYVLQEMDETIPEV